MQTLHYNAIIARSRKHLFGEMVGSNPSFKEGDGYDFAKIRPYMYGDNVKRIDWKQSAKTGQMQLRSFYEEKEIDVYALGLLSGSLHFGVERLKQALMAEVVALLGFSAVKNGDFFSTVLIGKRCRYESFRSKKEAMVREATKQTLEMSLIGESPSWALLQHYALNRIKKPSLLFLLGDFFEHPMLEAIAHKHRVVAVMIRDHFEENPTPLGPLYIKDPTSLKEEKIVLDDRLCQAQRKRQEAFDQKLQCYFREHQIAYVHLYSNEDPFIKLASFLGTV